MIHRPFLRSAIQVVGDFRIGDFDLQSYIHVVPSQRRQCMQGHYNTPASSNNDSATKVSVSW